MQTDVQQGYGQQEQVGQRAQLARAMSVRPQQEDRDAGEQAGEEPERQAKA
jgi:hypothetical protein